MRRTSVDRSSVSPARQVGAGCASCDVGLHAPSRSNSPLAQMLARPIQDI